MGSITLYNYTIQIESRSSSSGKNLKKNNTFWIPHAYIDSSKICWMTVMGKYNSIFSHAPLQKRECRVRYEFNSVVLHWVDVRLLQNFFLMAFLAMHWKDGLPALSSLYSTTSNPWHIFTLKYSGLSLFYFFWSLTYLLTVFTLFLRNYKNNVRWGFVFALALCFPYPKSKLPIIDCIK